MKGDQYVAFEDVTLFHSSDDTETVSRSSRNKFLAIPAPLSHNTHNAIKQ